MRDIAKKLNISYNTVNYSIYRAAQTGSNQNRKRGKRPRCTTEQEDRYLKESSLRNRRLTSPQLAASLNCIRKTPVSTSTVKRQLRDAGLLGRVAMKSHISDWPIKGTFEMDKITQTLDRGTLPRRPASRITETCVLRVMS
jgi:hypothetical protein